jgi:hypothetical protein
MREIIVRYGKAWIGDIPPHIPAYPVADVLHAQVKSDSANSGERRLAAFKKAHGTNAGRYGELGASFTPDGSHEIKIEVAVPPEPSDTAANPFRPEFATTILQTTEATLRENPVLEGGLLRFDRAKAHFIDTGHSVIRTLSRGLIQLLDLHVYTASDEQIAAVIEQLYEKRQ